MRRTIILLLVLCCCNAVNADGKLFKQKGVEYSPGIPRQRAIISHKDWYETIIIDNYVNSASKSMAWVVPVPTKPTKIEAIDNGIVDSISWISKPRLVSEKRNATREYLMMFLLFSLLTIWPAKIIVTKRWVELILLAVVVFVLAAIILPQFVDQTAIARGIQNVRQLSGWSNVGNYETTVVTATKAEDLVKWLTDNGFDAPEKENSHEMRILQDYIQKGWCFTVAKIRNEGGSTLNPHPLAITFYSSKTVYPLQLTAFNSAPKTLLELYVIANTPMGCDKLPPVFCDKLIKKDKAGYMSSKKFWNGSVGAGELGKYLWDGCVVTKFEKLLEKDSSWNDMSFSSSRNRYFAAVYYTPQAVRQKQIITTIQILFVLPLFISFYVLRKRWPGRYGTIFLLLLILALAVGPYFVTRNCKPIPDYMDVKDFNPNLSISAKYLVISSFPAYLLDYNVDRKDITSENLGRLYKEFVASKYNEYGLSSQEGIGPGEYQIVKKDGKNVLAVYAESGEAYELSVENIIEVMNKYKRRYSPKRFGMPIE